MVRTLVYFIDMLPGERVNASSKSRALWRILGQLGGTNYTNVFVSGPDTPRGLGSFFFEGDLQMNPCRFGSWPGQTNQNSSVGELFKQAPGGFGVLLHNNLQTFPGNSVLPKNIESSKVTNSQPEFIAWVEGSNRLDSSFWFVQSNDFHYAVDNYGPSNLAFRLGLNSVASHLESLIQLALFDEVLLFSDHGYVRNFSKLDQESLLSNHRTKVFCFHSNLTTNRIVSSHKSLMLSDLPRTFLRKNGSRQSHAAGVRIVEEIRSPNQLDGTKHHRLNAASWRVIDANICLDMNDFEEIELGSTPNKLSDTMRSRLHEVVNSFVDSKNDSSIDAAPTVDWMKPLGNLRLPGPFLRNVFRIWSKFSFFLASPSSTVGRLNRLFSRTPKASTSQL